MMGGFIAMALAQIAMKRKGQILDSDVRLDRKVEEMRRKQKASKRWAKKTIRGMRP